MKIILLLFLETDDHVFYLHFKDQIFVSIITLI